MNTFGDLGGTTPQPVRLQGGVVFLRPYGCRNCGNAFWTEDDDQRRLPPGMHPCPHCGVESEVPSDVCQAKFWHGPGHQSSTRCHVKGPHEVHEVIYGSERQEARWRDGSYTDKLREQGIDFNPESYPENIGMSGFFDEPPEEEE